MSDFKFNNGDSVKDIITGYEGVIIGRTDWLTGCNTMGVLTRELKEGKPQEPNWIDENRLNLINEKEVILNKKEQPIDPGGPIISIPQQSNQR